MKLPCLHQAIAEALEMNKTVTHINLSDNNFGVVDGLGPLQARLVYVYGGSMLQKLYFFCGGFARQCFGILLGL